MSIAKDVCACCGCNITESSEIQIGTKQFCSNSCINIHSKHFKSEVIESYKKVMNKYYGM